MFHSGENAHRSRLVKINMAPKRPGTIATPAGVGEEEKSLMAETYLGFQDAYQVLFVTVRIPYFLLSYFRNLTNVNTADSEICK